MTGSQLTGVTCDDTIDCEDQFFAYIYLKDVQLKTQSIYICLCPEINNTTLWLMHGFHPY